MRCDDCGALVGPARSRTMFEHGAMLVLCLSCFRLRRPAAEEKGDPRQSHRPGQDPRAGGPPRGSGRPL
jgi:ribosome-binding protein aMBF1 (putative translation factor)